MSFKPKNIIHLFDLVVKCDFDYAQSPNTLSHRNLKALLAAELVPELVDVLSTVVERSRNHIFPEHVEVLSKYRNRSVTSATLSHHQLAVVERSRNHLYNSENEFH